MNKSIYIVYIGLSLFLLFAGKSNVHAAVPDTLNGSSIEYEYAFEEAIKQCNFGNYSQA